MDYKRVTLKFSKLINHTTLVEVFSESGERIEIYEVCDVINETRKSL